jgi:hypothetical protein
MKNALIISLMSFILVSTASASPFISAKLIFLDGRIMKGLSKPPDKPDDKKIEFRKSDKDEKTTFESSLLKSMVIYYPDDSVEFDRIKTYNYSGKKIYPEKWLVVLVRGYATLYFAFHEGAMLAGAGGLNTGSDRTWLCYRDGEEGASIISWVVGKVGANNMFKTKAPEYFKDYPELRQKIVDKIYTYKEIEVMVMEYNKWKRSKK